MHLAYMNVRLLKRERYKSADIFHCESIFLEKWVEWSSIYANTHANIADGKFCTFLHYSLANCPSIMKSFFSFLKFVTEIIGNTSDTLMTLVSISNVKSKKVISIILHTGSRKYWLKLLNNNGCIEDLQWQRRNVY